MAKRMPELQRAARILEIVARISSHPRSWTRARLALDFEVSERQITKDLDIIRHALRLELRYERGGGYYFERLPQLPTLSFTLPEALAILLAAQAGRRMAGISQEDLSAALGRLTSIMPHEFLPLLANGAMDPPSPLPNRHRESILSELFQAVASRESVDVEYLPVSRDGELTHRRFDPYTIIPNRHAWHVIGWCHLRRDIRIFKIDRIKKLTPANAHFEPDPEFDMDDFLGSGWGITRVPDLDPEDVELIFDGKVARWIAEETWHPSQQLEWLDDGRLRYRVRLPVTEEFSRWVLSSGANCQIVRPESLRNWIRSQVNQLVTDQTS